MGQLQGRQGLGLQHGVQVDVAVGPCTQEEIPRWDAEQPDKGMSPGVAGTSSPDT